MYFTRKEISMPGLDPFEPQFKLLFSIQILNSMNDEEMSCREVLIHVEVSGEESVTNIE